jgi:hypothetical protein
MSDQNERGINRATADGVIGRHPDLVRRPIFFRSSTAGELNTIRIVPLVVDCWRVEEIRFAFHSPPVRYTPEALPDPVAARIHPINRD